MDGKVAVIATGGTIASRYDPATGKTKASDSGEALVRALPGSERLPDICLENFATIHSFNFTLDDVTALAERLRAVLASEDVAGAVVTQGTDTLEETAYLLDLIVDTEKPIILTGAQLPADHPQSDGPRNVADSIVAAASPRLRGAGAVVCFNGEVHAARDVTKLDTSAVQTFTSLSVGRVGIVDQGEVVVHRRPTIRRRYPVQALRGAVPLIKLVLGADTVLLDAAVEARVDGLVVEAFGRGNVVASFTEPIGRAVAEGIPVVITSRCPEGRVRPIYGTGGGGQELDHLGVIFAGDLKGPKARALLLVLLASGHSPAKIRREFALNAP